MKKLILGIFVSTIFIYFSLKGISLDEVCAVFKNANYIFLIPSAVLFLMATFLRSLCWEVILSPIVKISQKKLFPITCVGYMGSTLIPLRIGEFIRPYLVSVESNIRLSSAVATILVERIFDIAIVLGALFLVIVSFALPEWLVRIGYGASVILVVLVSFLLLLYFKMGVAFKILGPSLKILPQKIQEKAERLVHDFVNGLKIVSSPTRLAYTLLLSFLVWGCFALGIFALFFFFNFQLSFTSALVVLICTVIGVSLPSAPGMVGNFQYASIVALSIFGIQKSDAISFAMLYYFMGIGKHILLGLIFLPAVNLSFKDMRERFNLGRKTI